jgi:phage-related protein
LRVYSGGDRRAEAALLDRLQLEGSQAVPVQDVVGRTLLDAQFGDHPTNARVLRGFGGAGVLEIIDDHDGDTYRAVYTVKFSDAVYVLHCFQKKSRHGIETPQRDIDVIRARLKSAEEHHRGSKGGAR